MIYHADPVYALRLFLADGRFAAAGAVIIDLDGTAVLEREGRIYLPSEVEMGLKRMLTLGRPVIASTMRFPLSVIRVFGDDWHRAIRTDLPLVPLEGNQIGRIVRSTDSADAFEEWHARYASASKVSAEDVQELKAGLHAESHCMILLFIDLPEDRPMAYQHTQRSSYFTRAGVNKRFGAERTAVHLGFDLAASIGSGDAPRRLPCRGGLAIIVGNNDAVGYQGLRDTVRARSIAELGTLLAAAGTSLE